MAPIPSARLGRKTRSLIQAAKDLSCAPEGAVSSLCHQVLFISEDSEDYLPGASCLNSDGAPLQLCISADKKRSDLRIIGDPGANLPGIEDRYRSSYEALLSCLESCDSKEILETAKITFQRLLPSEEEGRSFYRNGFLWIGASPDRAGAAFYLEAAPLGRIRGWQEAEQWLHEILPSDGPAKTAIARLRDLGVIASMGLEGSAIENSRAKIYFRLVRSASLCQLGLDPLVSEEVAHFLRIAMDRSGLDLSGLVLSVGFSLKTGELVDAKIDLCGHCLAHSKSKWLEIIRQLSDRFDLAPIPLSKALVEHNCEIAFLGFGLDKSRNSRLNVYLKASDPYGSLASGEIEAAIKDGAGYLCSIQRDNGSWCDYTLPVGICDQWITAYVGLSLARYAHQTGSSVFRKAAENGAAWLCRDRSYSAGWGYNGVTGPDADSTAISLQLLQELGLSIRPEDQAFLLRHWRMEGGMATYDRDDAWGTAHWDVTPLGYLGLNNGDRHRLRNIFLKGLEASRMSTGMWRAYWWRNPFYSTFVTLETLDKLCLKEPEFTADTSLKPIKVDNAFDLACLIGIKTLRSASFEDISPLLCKLLSWQRADGRWPGHPNLRVTDPSCYEPWVKPSGIYYTDEAATITTATVIRILSLLQKRSAY